MRSAAHAHGARLHLHVCVDVDGMEGGDIVGVQTGEAEGDEGAAALQESVRGKEGFKLEI